MGRLLRTCAFVLIGMLLVVACGQDNGGGGSGGGSTEDGIARVKAKGIYAGFFGEEPFAFIDQPKGTYTGLDAEVVKTCSGKLGVKEIFPVQTQWDGLIPGLVAKRYDLIAAGMSTAPKRLEVAIATQPMYKTGSRAMVPKGNPLNIHSWSDITKAGATMGYVTGGLEGDSAKKLGVKSKGYDSFDAMVRDLSSGRLKVIVTAEITLKRYIEKTKAPFELVEPWDYQDQGFTPAIYFNKADVGLRDAFNDCISGMKQDGSLKGLMEKFGFPTDGLLPVQAPPS
jgi:polar amino acid transport system substrate-binding protein